jgi:hypothetical protein
LAYGIPATSGPVRGCITSASVTKALLAIHVLAAIIAIGPVTVAASMFPAAARRGERGTLRLLHRICRVYAALAVVVPVFGLATATSLGVLTDAWLLTSIALTVIAAAVLGLAVLPAQAAMLTEPAEPAEPAAATAATAATATVTATTVGDGSTQTAGPPENVRAARRLGMVTGVFNLLWAVVVVLMIVRPGSTTGA